MYPWVSCGVTGCDYRLLDGTEQVCVYLLCLREGRGGGRHQDVSASFCQLPVSPCAPQIHITLPPEVPVLQEKTKTKLFKIAVLTV